MIDEQKERLWNWVAKEVEVNMRKVGGEGEYDKNTMYETLKELIECL